LYHYYVGCRFDDGRVTEGNAADEFFFSVDASAPSTSLVFSSSLEDYEPTEWKDELSLSFVVKNNDPLLVWEMLSGGTFFDGNNPLVETYYSLDGGQSYSLWDGAPIVLHPDDISSSPKAIYYYSVDGFGNREEVHRTNLALRDLEVRLRGVELCTSQNDCLSIYDDE